MEHGMITKKTPIRDLLTKYPQAAEVFAGKGMGCLSCSAAMFETIEEGALAHGLNPDALVDEMNAALKS
jgi:hybrid cluster-associated redox disulfide protein